MKLTKETLRQIIKEELGSKLNEFEQPVEGGGEGTPEVDVAAAAKMGEQYREWGRGLATAPVATSTKTLANNIVVLTLSAAMSNKTGLLSRMMKMCEAGQAEPEEGL